MTTSQRDLLRVVASPSREAMGQAATSPTPLLTLFPHGERKNVVTEPG